MRGAWVEQRAGTFQGWQSNPPVADYAEHIFVGKDIERSLLHRQTVAGVQNVHGDL